MERHNPQTAIVLAAGKGTRMGSDKPKVLHTVLGTPMVVRVIRSALDAGMDRVIVVVGHEADTVIQTVQDYIKSDRVSGSTKRAKRYSRCSERLAEAGRVRRDV